MFDSGSVMQSINICLLVLFN